MRSTAFEVFQSHSFSTNVVAGVNTLKIHLHVHTFH